MLACYIPLPHAGPEGSQPDGCSEAASVRARKQNPVPPKISLNAAMEARLDGLEKQLARHRRRYFGCAKVGPHRVVFVELELARDRGRSFRERMGRWRFAAALRRWCFISGEAGRGWIVDQRLARSFGSRLVRSLNELVVLSPVTKNSSAVTGAEVRENADTRAGGRVCALRSSVDHRIVMTNGAIPATGRRSIHPAWEFISLRTQPDPLRCALTSRMDPAGTRHPRAPHALTSCMDPTGRGEQPGARHPRAPHALTARIDPAARGEQPGAPHPRAPHALTARIDPAGRGERPGARHPRAPHALTARIDLAARGGQPGARYPRAPHALTARMDPAGKKSEAPSITRALKRSDCSLATASQATQGQASGPDSLGGSS
jgi:hypothetical protein